MADHVDVPPKAVAPTGLNHLVLNVRDMEESHAFWCDILGFHQVGELKVTPDRPNPANMRFYSGVVDGTHDHHDVALVESEGLQVPPDERSMAAGTSAINHIAVTYPDRESWLQQVAFLQAQGVKINRRVDHGMTHSVYINDPNGYGVECLYELPRDVWGHDIDGALNYAAVLPTEESLRDDTDYKMSFNSPER